jgi:small conductance mechanosensitive channel
VIDTWNAIEKTVRDLTPGDWAAVVAIVAAGVALTFVAGWMVRRAVKRVDAAIPADVSSTSKGVARVLVWTAYAIIALGTGLGVLAVAGVDTGLVSHALSSWGMSAARWALPVGIRLAVLIVITAVVLRVIRATVPRAVQRTLARHGRHDDQDRGEAIKRRTTLVGVVMKVCSGAAVLLASFVGLSELGFDIGPILAGAGVIGLAIGFGAQHLVRDYLAGIFILFEDQYRVGDVVDIAGKIGEVEELDLRRTVLRDLDKTVHIIPNGEIRTASNFSKDLSQVHFDVEVAYKEDLDHVIEIINRVGRQMHDDKCLDGALREPIYVLRVNTFGASGIGIKVLGTTAPGQHWAVAGEFRRRLKRAFDEENIEIPFPQRVVHMRPAAGQSQTG